MGLSNTRIKATYAGVAIGIGTAYFIDSSKRPIRFALKDQKFTFGCEVVVTEATQAAFAASCTTLENAFNRGANKNGGLRIESDTQVYENLDPIGPTSFAILNYANLTGNTFTITANGTAVVLTAGTTFAIGASNAACAANLAAAINANGTLSPLLVATTSGGTVWLQALSACFGLTIATNAAGGNATATQTAVTAFNAEPSIEKVGTKTDTALSRRYSIEVTLDIPYTEAGKNGRRDSTWTLMETDSRRRRLSFEGVYTALGTNTAFQQYDASIDPYCVTIQKAVGGVGTVWEGPFDVQVTPDDNYAVAQDGTHKAGKVLRYKRTYEELIYNQSLGTLDNVKLRRHQLHVVNETPAPGDYGPNGKQVFRLQTCTVTYSCAVDKTLDQDLVTIYKAVVRPFLLDEAKKVVGSTTLAVVFARPDLDRVENRISAALTVVAAGSSRILSSSVETEDEDNPGTQLVAVWDGRPLSKEEFSGPATLRRTVTQRYRLLGGPTSDISQAIGGGSVLRGIDGSSTVSITAPNGAEAALDAFFGISTASASGSGGSGDAQFPVSGGVPEPTYRRVYRHGRATISPKLLGNPGDPQMAVTDYVKVKTFEYILAPKGPGGIPDRTISPGAGGSADDSPGTGLTRQRPGGSAKGIGGKA